MKIKYDEIEYKNVFKKNMKTKKIGWMLKKIFFKIFNIKREKKTILSWGLTINKETV